MMKMLGLFLYGLVLFGLAAGTGWFLKSRMPAETPAQSTNGDPNAAAVPELSDTEWGTPVTVSAAARTAESGLPVNEDGTSVSGGANEMPTAVRPNQMSVEEIVRYSLGLKSRDEAIRAREEVLKRSETQYQLLLADLRGEKKELEGLVTQARDQRLATEELLRKAEVLRQQADAAKQQTEAERKSIELEAERRKADAERNGTTSAAPEADLQATIKSVAPLLENMTVEKSSEAVQQMVQNNNLELAAGVIGAMDERKASALLEAISDVQLRNLLLEQQGKKKPTTVRSARGR